MDGEGRRGSPCLPTHQTQRQTVTLSLQREGMGRNQSGAQGQERETPAPGQEDVWEKDQGRGSGGRIGGA